MTARLVYIQTSVNAYVSGEELTHLLEDGSMILHVSIGKEVFGNCFATLNLNDEGLELFRQMYLLEAEEKAKVRASLPGGGPKNHHKRIRRYLG
jgi:hypothetical protein